MREERKKTEDYDDDDDDEGRNCFKVLFQDYMFTIFQNCSSPSFIGI